MLKACFHRLSNYEPSCAADRGAAPWARPRSGAGPRRAYSRAVASRGRSARAFLHRVGTEARRLRAELLRTVGLDELAEEEESTMPLDGLSEAETADLVAESGWSLHATHGLI